MSIGVDFVLPALLVSGGALIALRLACAAPSGVRLGIALIGLLAWLVPWPLISMSAPQQGFVPMGEWVGQGIAQLSSIKHEVSSSLGGMGPAVPAPWWLVVFVPGLIWFGVDSFLHMRTVQRLRRVSRSGEELVRLLPATMVARAPRIRIVRESSVAFVAGLWNATIWVGEGIGDDEVLRVALAHESAHLRRRDPLRLVLLTLIARLYWFNPIVHALRREAVLAIENGCDEACALSLGRERYRETLARLVLQGQRRRGLTLVPTLRSASFDLTRLVLLADGTRMSGRAWIAALIVLIASAGGAALAAATWPDLRIGDWIEVTESARYGYDVPPGTRRFERLANGMTRIGYVDDSTGRAKSESIDLRCDGNEYSNQNASGEHSLTISCVAVDPWTNTYVTRWLDGSGRVEFSTETVSRDGATIEMSTRREFAGLSTETARTFGRFH